MILGSREWCFDRITGVIDLAGGKAVHAVSGKRAAYQPVQSCRGDAMQLIRQYRQLGVNSFYIADLDAICGRPLQATLLDEMAAEMDCEVLVDLGWSGAESASVVQAISSLAESHPCLGIIAATETADSPAALIRLTECIAVTRICLGLDFREGQLVVSPNFKDQEFELAIKVRDVLDHAPVDHSIGVPHRNNAFDRDPACWVEYASSLGIRRMVVLDIATVGKQVGTVTAKVCCNIKQTHPEFSIWSGGGIRNAADANQLIQQGCDRCLVATALQVLL